jgi:hypothetical protein
MWARLADAAARAGLDFAYLAIGLATSVLAFCVWVTALSVTISLLIFVVGLPLFLLSAIAFRWTAELDRRNAALVLGEPLRARYRDHGGEGFFERLGSTAGDLQTWKDLLWLILHSGLGFALGVAAVTAVALVAGMATMPAWYWAIDGGPDVFAAWQVDSLGRALLCTLAALPLAAITVGLLRGMALAESWLARALLQGDGGAAPAAGAEGRLRLPTPEVPLAAHAAVSATLAAIVLGVWAATGGGYFWPAWVWLGLAIPLGLHGGLREALRAAPEQRALAVQAVLSALVVAIAVAVWALAGAGSFWPIWVLLGVAVGFAYLTLARRRHAAPAALAATLGEAKVR